jgi:drug/metabolite transporter (DMT)-like permease
MDANVQLLLQQREIAYAKKGIGWGLMAGLLWGGDGVLMGISLGMLPFTNESGPFAIALVGACMHDGFAAGWVFLINIISGKWRDYVRTLKTRPAKGVLLAGIVGGPIGMSGNLLGIHLAGASYAIAITALYPALGALLGVLFLKERIHFRVGIGILLSIAGSIIVGYVPPEGNFPDFYLGICFSLMAAIAWALEGVVSTYGMDIIDFDIAVGIREISSFLVYLLVVLPLIGMTGFKILFSTIEYTSFLYIAVAALIGGGSYLSWYRSMNMTGVGRAMGLNVTYALWSVFFGWLLSDLQLTWNLFIGVVVITIGTIVMIGKPEGMANVRS